MNDEYEILGITGELTFSKLKKAYRSRVKELHPDINQDNDVELAHQRMVSTIKAYEILLRKLEDSRDTGGNHEAGPGEDSEYALYKRGIQLFQSVHPSKWTRMTFESLFVRSDYQDADPAETAEIVARLMGNLGEAKYHFNRLIHKHAGSRWEIDARDKIRQIDGMTARYHRIIESYRKEHDT